MGVFTFFYNHHLGTRRSTKCSIYPYMMSHKSRKEKVKKLGDQSSLSLEQFENKLVAHWKKITIGTLERFKPNMKQQKK